MHATVVCVTILVDRITAQGRCFACAGTDSHMVLRINDRHMMLPRACVMLIQLNEKLTEPIVANAGAIAGLLGSLLDSILGATVQFTGDNTQTQKVTSKSGPGVEHISGSPFLTNNLVNLISASVISAGYAAASVDFY